MDIHELVTVYTVTNHLEGEMIKNALNTEGIRCFLGGAGQAGEAGVGAFEINIQVPAADADRARKFIRAHERHSKARSS
jgi:hypothetical protein